MATPIKGVNGIVTVDPGLSTTEQFVWIGEWEVSIKQSSQNVGPHLGDPKIYKSPTSVLVEWSMKGTIPTGGDRALRRLRAKANGGSANVGLEFAAFGGDDFDFDPASVVVDEYKSSQKANGTHEFECKGSGILNQLADWPV